jgi:tetratricopeptide (TPR) repeat protein
MRALCVPILILASSAWAAPTAIPTSVSLAEGFEIPPPRGLELRLLNDAKDGILNDVDLVSAALVASGVSDADVAAEKARVERAVAGPRARAKTQKDARKRGATLLSALHETLFRRYVEDQSRVDAVVGTGEYNCLSSAVVFVIAADGLVDNPRGMMALTHAFVRADVSGKPVDVETTTKDGFAVDREALVTVEYLRRLGVGDGLSEAQRLADLKNPQEVPTLGLIAGLYSNRGVLAIRRGDIEGAALAFDRATRLSTGPLRARVANWRGALLNNAVAPLLKEGRALDARRLLAVGLDGASGETRKTLQQNVAAVAAQQAGAARDAGRYAEALAYVDDALGSGGANAATARQLKALRGELQGRLAGGDASRCGPMDAPTSAAQRQERGVCLAAVAAAAAKAGDDDKALDLARVAVTLAPGPQAEPVLFNALQKAVSNARQGRRCERVDVLVPELTRVARKLSPPPKVEADTLRASCYWAIAGDAVDAKKYDVAAEHFARAAVFLPNDQGLKKNRGEIELRLAEEHAVAGRCDAARPHVRRAQKLGADEGRGLRLLEICANERSTAAAEQKNWAEAVAELRRGLIDVPDSAVLSDNLGRMLHNHTVAALKSKRCDEALALVPELKARGRAIADDVAKVCR